MAITNGLITVAEFAQYTGYTAPTGTKLTELEACIESASRMVESYCGREFHSTASSARFFDVAQTDGQCVYISDATSISAVAVDDTIDGTYATTVTDYQALPVAYDPILGAVPYSELRSYYAGAWPTSTYRVGLVKVTAVWGWAAVPIQVKHATSVLAQDLLRDAQAGFGGLQISDLGIVNSRIPQRVKDILGVFRRAEFVFGIG